MRKPLRPLTAINTSFTTLILILSFPVIAIMVSWNSIPGSFLYPVKRGLENTALALLPNSLIEINLRFGLLDRRTNEASAILIQQVSDRPLILKEILLEAQTTRLALNTLSPKAKKKATKQLIAQLNQTNQQLEQIKTTIPIQPNTPNSTPPSQNNNDQNNNDLQNQINDLQNQIDDLIDTIPPPPAVDEPPPAPNIPSPEPSLMPSPNLITSPQPSP